MNDRHRTGASGRDRVTGALDRRVRRVDRIGEIPIALEAAALRGESLTRIEELKSAELDRQTREAELADAVMTDDGAPVMHGHRIGVGAAIGSATGEMGSGSRSEQY